MALPLGEVVGRGEGLPLTVTRALKLSRALNEAEALKDALALVLKLWYGDKDDLAHTVADAERGGERVPEALRLSVALGGELALGLALIEELRETAGEDEGVPLNDGDEETLAQSVADAERGGERVADAQLLSAALFVLLALKLVHVEELRVAASEDEAALLRDGDEEVLESGVVEGERGGERVTLAQLVADAERGGERVSKALRLSVALGGELALKLALVEELREAAGEDEGMPLNDGDEETLAQSVADAERGGERVADAQLLSAALFVLLALKLVHVEELRVAASEDEAALLRDGDEEVLESGVVEGERGGERVTLAQTVADAERGGERVAVAQLLSAALFVLLALKLVHAEELRVAASDSETALLKDASKEKLARGVVEGERGGERVTLAQKVADAERGGERVADAQPLPERLPLGETDARELAEADTDGE